MLGHSMEVIPSVLSPAKAKQTQGGHADLTFPAHALTQAKLFPKSLIETSGRMRTARGGEAAPVSAFSASSL